jgi:uncharacterized protein (UPF0261 family)
MGLHLHNPHISSVKKCKDQAGSMAQMVEHLPSKLHLHNPHISSVKKCKDQAGSMAQMVEHLPSKCEGLSSNTSTAQNKTKKAS